LGITVQRPSTLDTVCALTLLQEEADSSRRREHRGSEGAFPGHSYPKLLAPPPSRWDKSLGGETVATKVVVSQSGSSTDKIASLLLIDVPMVYVNIVLKMGKGSQVRSDSYMLSRKYGIC
jgi:hypothetical protein